MMTMREAGLFCAVMPALTAQVSQVGVHDPEDLNKYVSEELK
jgi:hypothetical protein